MSVAKLSISLPDSLAGFVESYRKRRGLKSRSQVFEEAVRLLRSRDLETAYREANAECDKAWEITLIVSNEANNRAASTATVLPITSRVSKIILSRSYCLPLIVSCPKLQRRRRSRFAPFQRNA
jgi:metal-responsive CopG/Arc/MetJ family transcriptional regulator